MNNHLRKSFEKLKQDALSKIFYDILKWLLGSTVVFASSDYLPDSSAISQFLSKTIELSIYSISLIALLIILLTVLIVSFIFNQKYKTIRENAVTDDLTGLKNHKALRIAIDEKIHGFSGIEKTFSIIILDVDDFKKFNSQYGTNVADSILSKLGELLSNDKRITDETFRQFLRGDEFVILASETNLDNAYKAAERKRALIEQTTFSIGNDLHNLTVSCGVTEFKKGKDDFVLLTNRANQALNQAKSILGKNNTKTII